MRLYSRVSCVCAKKAANGVEVGQMDENVFRKFRIIADRVGITTGQVKGYDGEIIPLVGKIIVKKGDVILYDGDIATSLAEIVSEEPEVKSRGFYKRSE